MKLFNSLALSGVLFAAATTSAFAAAGDLRAGLQGGVNLANAKIETETRVGTGTATAADVTTNTRTGIAVGLYGEYLFHEFLGIRPELTYLQKGAKTGTGAAEVTTALDYLEIPVLLEAKFDQGEFRPFLFAGPALGIKLSASTKPTGGTSSTLNDIKSIDFGLDFGGGLEYAVNKQWGVQFNVRYGLGLTDVSDVSVTAGTTTVETNIKNRGVQFMAGVSYGY